MDCSFGDNALTVLFKSGKQFGIEFGGFGKRVKKRFTIPFLELYGFVRVYSLFRRGQCASENEFTNRFTSNDAARSMVCLASSLRRRLTRWFFEIAVAVMLLILFCFILTVRQNGAFCK